MEHRTDDGGGQSNYLAYMYIQSTDPKDSKRMCFKAGAEWKGYTDHIRHGRGQKKGKESKSWVADWNRTYDIPDTRRALRATEGIVVLFEACSLLC